MDYPIGPEQNRDSNAKQQVASSEPDFDADHRGKQV